MVELALSYSAIGSRVFSIRVSPENKPLLLKCRAWIGDYAPVRLLENHLPTRATDGPAVPIVDEAEANRVVAGWARHEPGAGPTDDQMVAASASAVPLARVDQAVLRRTAPDASGSSMTVALPSPETPLAATPETPEADVAATSETGASGAAASARPDAPRRLRRSTAAAASHLIQGRRRGLAALSLLGPTPSFTGWAGRCRSGG